MLNGRHRWRCGWSNRFVIVFVRCVCVCEGLNVVVVTGSLQEVFGTTDLWHVALSVYVVLVVVCMLPYYWFPESPKYLYIIVKDYEAAKNRNIFPHSPLRSMFHTHSMKILSELQQLRGSQIALINEELQSMENEAVFQSEKRSLWSVLRDPKLLLPVILVCALQGGQQLSGINAVFYYSVSIFQRSGLSLADAQWANLGAGCINLLIAAFSPYLMAKVNRRPLAFWSVFVSGVMLSILTVIVSLIVSIIRSKRKCRLKTLSAKFKNFVGICVVASVCMYCGSIRLYHRLSTGTGTDSLFYRHRFGLSLI